VLAEFLPVDLDQPAAVSVLFARHLGEHLGRGGVIVLQPLGVVGIDASVLFLERDGDGENLLLGQVGKSFHGGPRLWLIDLELF
jgi:hypothetical protein